MNALAILPIQAWADAEIVISTRYLQAETTSHSHPYLYREDGKLLRQLTNDNSGHDSAPIFSANGETIVFHARKSQQRARILEYRAGVVHAHGKSLRANSLGGPTHRSTARTARSIKLADARSALNRSPAICVFLRVVWDANRREVLRPRISRAAGSRVERRPEG